MTILGHDPLPTISMAAQILERGGGENKMSLRIRASSSRMQRLVSQVLDLSRSGSGIGVGIQLKDVDIELLIEDLVDEVRIAYPFVNHEMNVPDSLMWQADSDRLAQAIGNLLGNARVLIRRL